MDKLIGFFNQRSSGEQTLLLISAGILFLVAGIQVGRLAFFLFGG